MNKVIIGNARITDSAALAELAGELGYPAAVQQTANRLRSILNSKEHGVLIAAIPAGPVVGWIHVFISRRIESDPFAEIGGFVVAGTHRGTGIGRKLLLAAEQWAAEQNITKIRIRSRTNRNDSHSIFQHLGYLKSKEQLVFDKDLLKEI